MNKFRRAGTLALCLVLLCGLVYPFAGSNVLAASVNVSYSTSDGTTLSQAVGALTANGTADATFGNFPTWLSPNGLRFNYVTGGNELASTGAPTMLGNQTAETILIWASAANYTSGQAVFYTGYFASLGGCWMTYGGGSDVLNLYLKNTAGVTSTTLNIGVGSANVNLIGFTWDGTNWYSILNTTVANQKALSGILATSSFIWASNAIDNISIYGTYFMGSNITQAQLNAIYAAGPNGFSYQTGLKLWYGFNEGSGSYVYGYDDATPLTATATARTLSQTASAVNSSIILTDTYPIGNSTDRYSNSTGYSYRWNSSAAFVMQYLHEVYDTFAVSPVGAGSVNQTTGWYTTLTYLGINVTPYMGYSFANYTKNGAYAGNNITETLYVLASASIVANFAIASAAGTPLSIIVSVDTIAQWIIFAVALLLTLLAFYYRDVDDAASVVSAGLGIIRLILFPLLAVIFFGVFAGMALVSLNYGATFAWALFLLGFALALVMLIVTVAISLIAAGKVFQSAERKP